MRAMWKLVVVPGMLLLGACADDGPMAAGDELVPAYGKGAAAGGRALAASTQAPTIVDVALAVNAETGEFSTLIAAVVAADLVDALSANGQRTVFAPTDAAFAALGLNAGNVGTLPKETLTNILLYHVTPGRRDAASVLGASRIRMANGGFTRISLQNGAPFINGAGIIGTDVLAGNGIIHVIDGVLLP
jgi:uncharacterized surface protein with fasciclin (FAS1) repeats